MIFFLISCQFLPQIYTNTINGYRLVPDINYAMISLLFTLFLPLYMYSFDLNIFFIRPDPVFVLILVSIVLFQIITLKI